MLVVLAMYLNTVFYVLGSWCGVSEVFVLLIWCRFVRWFVLGLCVNGVFVWWRGVSVCIV